jgi:purine-binding chemotaxis protein CheW
MEPDMSTDARVAAEPLLGFADSLPAPAGDAAAPAAMLHLLTFSLDREEFGIPVTQVREVIRVDGITRVPQVPAHVRGVTNLRGRILAVVEIRTRLGLTPAVVTPASRIVVVEVMGRALGVLVDRVSQVTKVPVDSVAAPPEEVVTAETDFLTGVARWNSRLIMLLDLDKVLLLHA